MKVGDWVKVKISGLEYIAIYVSDAEVWVLDDDSLVKLPKDKVIVVETVEHSPSKISPHYTENADGKDYLQRFFESETPEAVRGAMVFTIGKYIERLGKKDAPEKELAKVIDYCTRYRNFLTK